MEREEIHIANNKKAHFQYQLSNYLEAGIQLTGTEIKSVRGKQVNINDAHCFFINEELWIKGMHIPEYKEGTYNNHEPKRIRKLLLKKSELKKLQSRVKEKGFTIVPARMYISKRGLAKIEIALAKGKKQFDKRADIKKREADRELKRIEKELKKH